MDNQKSNLFKNIGVAMVVFLTLFFAYFLFNKTNTYKDEINGLNTSKTALESKIDSFYVHKDSILYYLSEIESLNSELNVSLKKIERIKNDFNKKESDYINYISVDSNIIILTKLLSSKDSVK